MSIPHSAKLICSAAAIGRSLPSYAHPVCRIYEEIISDSVAECTAYYCASCCAMRSASFHEAAALISQSDANRISAYLAMPAASFLLGSILIGATQSFQRGVLRVVVRIKGPAWYDTAWS